MSDVIHLPTVFQMILGIYAYLLPLLLYVLWTSLALWDLGRRESVSGGALWGWCTVIFLLPMVGPVAYLLLGGGETARNLKLASIGGGIGLYVIILVVGQIAGGIA